MPAVNLNAPVPVPVPIHHSLILVLWLTLAAAYLLASVGGFSAMATAIVGLMCGALLVSSGRPVTGCILGVTLAGLFLYFADSLRVVVYAPPLAAFAFMALFFWRTLRPGSEPLITRIARREHAEMPAEVVLYTRRLTWLWSLCFMFMFASTAVLAVLVTVETWSRWVHAMGYVLPATLFLGEYAYRQHRFRDRPRRPLWLLIPTIVAVSREAALSARKPDADAGP